MFPQYTHSQQQDMQLVRVDPMQTSKHGKNLFPLPLLEDVLAVLVFLVLQGTVRARTMSSQRITNPRYFIPPFHGNITMAPSMSGPNEKSVPRFESSTDPEELERFFARLEELFDKSAVVTDVEKKKYTVSYTDIKMDKQWKVLEHYVTGTFAEFKKDVLGSYDSALAGDHDTMQEMKQLVRRYRLSPIQERSDYMSFK